MKDFLIFMIGELPVSMWVCIISFVVSVVSFAYAMEN